MRGTEKAFDGSLRFEMIASRGLDGVVAFSLAPIRKLFPELAAREDARPPVEDTWRSIMYGRASVLASRFSERR